MYYPNSSRVPTYHGRTHESAGATFVHRRTTHSQRNQHFDRVADDTKRDSRCGHTYVYIELKKLFHKVVSSNKSTELRMGSLFKRYINSKATKGSFFRRFTCRIMKVLHLLLNIYVFEELENVKLDSETYERI